MTFCNMITKKHHYHLFLASLVLAFASSSNSASADMYCTSASNYSAHTGVNSSSSEGDDGYCFHTAEKLNITLYEFGICNSPATPENREGCSVLFESPAGEQLEVSAGASIPVANGVAIPEGVYTHAYLIFSTTTSLEAAIEFTTPRIADNGTTGIYCYTDGRSIQTSASIISCGNDPSMAMPATEVLRLGDPNSYSNTHLNYTVTMMGQSVVMDLYAITSEGVLSNSDNDDFALFGRQSLSNRAQITANTSNIDIAFSVTDGTALGFSQNSGITAPVDALLQGIKFSVSVR
jgi:hypothetical protein